jgi:hypothetical protein
MHLAAPLQNIHALLLGNNRITVKIGRPLLKFGEILHRFQGPLGPEEPLDVHPPQGRGVDAVPEFLGPDVPHQMGGRVGVAIDVAVKTGHALAGKFRAPVFRLVELLLHERGDQKTQSLQLLGIQNAVEDFIEVHPGNQLPLGNVSQIRPGGQEDGRRELR